MQDMIKQNVKRFVPQNILAGSASPLAVNLAIRRLPIQRFQRASHMNAGSAATFTQHLKKRIRVVFDYSLSRRGFFESTFHILQS